MSSEHILTLISPSLSHKELEGLFHWAGSTGLQHTLSEPSAGKEAMRTTFSTSLDAHQFYSKLKMDPPKVAIHAASVVSAAAKKSPKKLYVFDMDSTFINQEVIDELGREIGAYDRFAEITEEAMKGQIDFVQAFYDRIAMLKGVTALSARNIFPRLTLSPGIESFLDWVRSTGAQTMIVSGGFQFVLEHFKKSTGIDWIHAHTLETDSSGIFTGKLAGNIIDGERKQKLVKEKMRELGLKSDEVVIVGDGANDIKMMSEASTRVAFQGKEKLNLETNTWILDRHYRWLKAML